MTENISGWRARQLTGVYVPADQGEKIEKFTKSVHEWLLSAGIDFAERVTGRNGTIHGFCLVIDDEGRDKGMPWNPRAQFLLGYPIEAPLVGNAIFWSTDWTDDGKDFVSLFEEAQRWLLDPAREREFTAWLADPEVAGYSSEYRLRYPHHQK